MKKIAFTTLAILAIVILCGIIFSVVFETHKYQAEKDIVISRTYEGREYFTEESYENFKFYLANNPDVEIEQLEVLSSERPLVTYRLIVPVEIDFPFKGEIAYTKMKANGEGFALLLMAFILGGGFFVWISLTIANAWWD